MQSTLTFAQSKFYTQRQEFVTICEGAMLHDPDLFTGHLINHFCELQSDKVINVRLLVSDTLAKAYTGRYETQTCLHDVIKRLRLDSSKDVRQPVMELNIPEVKRETVDLDEFVRSILDDVYEKVSSSLIT